MIVNGREPGIPGVDYYQLALLCKKLGCLHAIGLDGGQSSQLFMKKPGSSVINSCSKKAITHYPVGAVLSCVKMT